MSHHRCYRNKATAKYLVLGRDGIEFIDVKTGKGYGNNWVRGACQYGVMPCNGLVYSPPHSCACHIETKLDSFLALAPARETSEPSEPQSRLVRGPAFEQLAAETVAPIDWTASSDWPTYRGNINRAGRIAGATGFRGTRQVLDNTASGKERQEHHRRRRPSFRSVLRHEHRLRPERRRRSDSLELHGRRPDRFTADHSWEGGDLRMRGRLDLLPLRDGRPALLEVSRPAGRPAHRRLRPA